MLANLIEIKTTEKEALKKILSKIPLLSKVTQFNKGINDIDLKYIEYKILKYKIAICYPKIFNNFRMAISNMKGEHGICLDQARKNHSFKKNY